MLPLGSGLLAVAAAEALATSADDSVLDRLGQLVVDSTPVPLVERAISLLGTSDKPVLRAAIAAGLAGVVSPLLPRTRPAWQVLAAGAAAGLIRASRSALLARERSVTDDVTLPAIDVELPPARDGAEGWPNVVPLLTPAEQLYVTDVNLRPPAIDPDEWRLVVEGAEGTAEIDLALLTRLGLSERDALLACVHNRPGWDRLGQQRWAGVPMAQVLHHVGALPSSPQGLDLVMEAVDGYRQVMPLGTAIDARAWVVVGVDGRPLPIEHGFPARVMTPGIVGQYNGVKWLTRLAVVESGSVRSTWAERGWPDEAVWVAPMARIDWPAENGMPPRLPRRPPPLASGTTTVVGTAWAPPAGVGAVEVSVDEGPWEQAEMAEALNADSWRRWRHDVTLEAGSHRLRARCITATGRVQEGQPSDPFPDGATGWHTVTVTVA